MKLFNFGTEKKNDVDLVDTPKQKTFFPIIEGTVGYNIDGVDVRDGMRILFTAQEDIQVRQNL